MSGIPERIFYNTFLGGPVFLEDEEGESGLTEYVPAPLWRPVSEPPNKIELYFQADFTVAPVYQLSYWDGDRWRNDGRATHWTEIPGRGE